MQGHFRITGKGFKRTSWGLLALGLGLVAIIWANLFWTYRDIEAKTVRDLEMHLLNLGEALRLQTDSVLRGVDSVAIRLRREYQTRPHAEFESDAQGFINNAMEGFAVQAVIVDRQGMLAWSSEAANYPLDLRERRYFQVHAQAPQSDHLFIGTPILNLINERWIIPVSRPLPDFRHPAQPGFDGVIMISLDPHHFANLLQRVDLGRNGRIAIVATADGSYLVRNDAQQQWLNKAVAAPAPFLLPTAADKGVFHQVSEEDGLERLYAYQRLPEYGITLLAGLDLKEQLAPIHTRARASYALAVVVSAAILMLVLYLFRLLRRHGETEAELEAEHRVLREAERIGQVGSWQWDLDANELVGSEQLHRLFCFEESWGRIGHADFHGRIHPDDRERVKQAFRAARQEVRGLQDLEFRIQCPDGSLRSVLACGEHVPGSQHRQMIGTLLDITALRASQKQLLQAQIVFDNAQEAVVVTDTHGRILTVNPAFERITGYSCKEATGQSTNLLSSGRHSETFYRSMWEHLVREGHWEGEIWNRRKNGELYVEWLAIRAVQDTHGVIQQYVAVFSDITDRKRREEAVWHRAYHDALTGLPNRSLFQDRLEHAITTAQRDGSRLGVLFIDLDRFKEINDTLGHAAGDELLRQVAKRLRSCMRASDTVARLAGDEFMALVEGISQRDLLSQLAEKLLQQINQPFELAGGHESISASIGIALYPDDARRAETLLQRADQAMYAAKHAGRNAYAFAAGMVAPDAPGASDTGKDRGAGL